MSARQSRYVKTPEEAARILLGPAYKYVRPAPYVPKRTLRKVFCGMLAGAVIGLGLNQIIFKQPQMDQSPLQPQTIDGARKTDRSPLPIMRTTSATVQQISLREAVAELVPDFSANGAARFLYEHVRLREMERATRAQPDPLKDNADWLRLDMG